MMLIDLLIAAAIFAAVAIAVAFLLTGFAGAYLFLTIAREFSADHIEGNHHE